MGRVRDILEQHKDEIIRLRKEKKTYKEIAQLMNCSDTSVRTFCLSTGIEDNKNSKMKIIGQSFENSQLEVLEIDLDPPFKSHETGYKCKCLLCGEIKTYRRSNIIDGPGCHTCSGIKGGRGYREWSIGDKYGYVTIIGESKSKRYGYAMGRCDCGTVREFFIADLRHKNTISCGCSQKSKGEQLIEDILIAHNIEFISQYFIPDFSNYSAFDFALFKNGKLIGLLEYDGEQHFKPIEHFGGEEKFLIQQQRDKNKNDYCKNNNIHLERIPYTDYKQINIGYLLNIFPELKDEN